MGKEDWFVLMNVKIELKFVTHLLHRTRCLCCLETVTNQNNIDTLEMAIGGKHIRNKYVVHVSVLIKAIEKSKVW